MSSRYSFNPEHPLPDVPGLGDDVLEVEVPGRPDVLPDGRAVLVLGEPDRWKELPVAPGDSARSCGEQVLQRLGERAGAPPEAGELSAGGMAAWLEGAGIRASFERGCSLEDLAQSVESDLAAVAFVNSGELWGEPDLFGNGEADRAVLVTGVARDAARGAVVGAFVNDPRARRMGALVGAAALEHAWLDAGGALLVAGR
jgi:hypothetical protein